MPIAGFSFVNRSFMRFPSKEIYSGAVQEAIGRMYHEYISFIGKYSITNKPDGARGIASNSTVKRHNERVISRGSEGILSCGYMI